MNVRDIRNGSEEKFCFLFSVVLIQYNESYTVHSFQRLMVNVPKQINLTLQKMLPLLILLFISEL